MKRYASASMLESRATLSALCFALSFCLPAFAQVATPECDMAEELGMEFVSIPAGSFEMGWPSADEGLWDIVGPVHTVTIPAFEMLTTEVTQGMWEEVMGGNPALDYGVGSDYPVYCVSWDDCQDFIDQLNAQDAEYEYRLPSEAEWEYACRAGTSTAYYWGTSMDTRYCWFSDGSDDALHPVGQKLPNAWGLYDMSGNVWEWCEDLFHESYSGAPTDGSAWLSPASSYRVTRGGSWETWTPMCFYSTYHCCVDPGRRSASTGLRLARSAEGVASDTVSCVSPGSSEPEPGAVSRGPVTGMLFAWIPPGSFDMGSPSSEPDRNEDEDLHRVMVGSFELMTTEVTQGMWREVMGGDLTPDWWEGEDYPGYSAGKGDDYPVYDVLWDDSQEFLAAMNDLDPNHIYRLPTEAEWEYACRAGTTTAYYWGNTMNGSYCWYEDNSENTTHPVGQKYPNAWGLYDISGNVYEWCEDAYASNYEDCPDDGSAYTDSGYLRVFRGGSRSYGYYNCRSACRGYNGRGYPSELVGLRLARSAR